MAKKPYDKLQKIVAILVGILMILGVMFDLVSNYVLLKNSNRVESTKIIKIISQVDLIYKQQIILLQSSANEILFRNNNTLLIGKNADRMDLLATKTNEVYGYIMAEMRKG